ncbi:MAG: 5-(carboxyamino)imidazole ribonucleotide synthase [Ktedonobacterales bacterium]|nr:5-(carboxyamino)imidazole ribonucleotide synthase [Ktedonobacterales bacterium]
MTTIGILGGGQLGRMLALAGYPLGFQFRFLDPTPGTAPVDALAPRIRSEQGYDDAAALAQFRDGLDVVTYEFENVPVATAERLAAQVPVFPPPAALQAAQDRFIEKSFFRDLGIPTPPFERVDSLPELEAAVAKVGLPAMLKTRRLGYDGKGQQFIRAAEDVAPAWHALGNVPLILEGFVDFDRELSILAVRGQDGATAFYPLVQNRHHDGILHRSVAPAPDLSPEAQALAQSFATRVMEEVGYVGVLAIELFGVGETLIANEMAPRVHNSGHWTIEGAETSQFENHLRAVAGLPLGSTAMRGHAAMFNILGEFPPDITAILAIPGTHLHLYDKAPRPGRKLGHVTLRCDDGADFTERLAQVKGLLRG